MAYIGIDFGSTYTTVSVYRKETGMVEALSMSSSPYTPTTAALMGDKYEFGKAARARTGKKGASIYKGFKMLLPETDQELLRARGYDGGHTPRSIASQFLEHCLRQALSDLHETQVDSLVVGAPEIWQEKEQGKEALRDIFRDMAFVKNTQVVSEPVAATAFFAYNFKRITGKEFSGNILLIDYGGGTLDLTLTRVLAGNAPGAVEIQVMERTGAGENENGRIGQAGIVYMETVAAEAIARILGVRPEPDGRFYRAVDSLEEELQTRTEVLQETFDEYGTQYPEDLDFEFTSLEYQGEEIPVTYALLVECYDRVIRPVLEEQLDHMIGYMKKANIPYMDREQDVFKIALVGGFGNFYLVRQQLQEKFRFSTMDRRQEHIIVNRADREKAISMGAAMLSAGAISVCSSAPCTIGVLSRDVTGKSWADYALKKGQTLEYGKPYFAADAHTGAAGAYLVTQGRLTRLLVEDETGKAPWAPMKESYARRVADAIRDELQVASVGFSVEPSGILFLHLRRQGEEDRQVELTQFQELFDWPGAKQVNAL